jgi:nucleoside recognition membrane protein YjiH
MFDSYIPKKKFRFFRNVNITFIQTDEATQINNDHLIAQTMAVLAAKHRYVIGEKTDFSRKYFH